MAALIYVYITISLLFISGSSVVSTTGCGVAPPTGTHFNYSYQGNDHEYIVYLPSGYDYDTQLPVIYMLPGYGMWPGYFETHFGHQSLADQENFIFIITEGEQFESPVWEGYYVRSWNDLSCSASPINGVDTCDRESAIVNWGSEPDTPTECADGGAVINVTSYDNACNWCSCESDDVGYLKELVAYIDGQYCTDTGREYLMGFSNGGMMAQRMACEANDIFAAVTSFHGQMHNAESLNCEPSDDMYKMPFMNVGNVNDDTVPMNGGEDIYGWYYLSAQEVQDKFAEYNGCDISDGMEEIDSVSDGTLGWECKTYNEGCDNDATTQFCTWESPEVLAHDITCDYIEFIQDATWGPDDVRTCKEGATNFGLAAAWEFMSQFNNNDLVYVEETTDSPDVGVPKSEGLHLVGVCVVMVINMLFC